MSDSTIITDDNFDDWKSEHIIHEVPPNEYLFLDGSIPLSADWDAGDHTITTKTIVADNIEGGNLIAHDEFYNNYNSFGAKHLFNGVEDNILYAGETRFEVTRSGFSITNFLELFTGNELTAGRITAGDTATINIDLLTYGTYGANGVTYAAGYFYVDFYHLNVPESISMRVKDRDDIWTDITEIENISIDKELTTWKNAYIIYRATCPITNYVTEIELTINASSSIDTWKEFISHIHKGLIYQ